MSDALAELLRKSPFDSLQHARNFLHWHKRQDQTTDWDNERRDLAEELLTVFEKEPKAPEVY